MIKVGLHIVGVLQQNNNTNFWISDAVEFRRTEIIA
jgi:hypothetical protein